MMTMKTPSKKLLLTMYSLQEEKILRNYPFFEKVFPELSAGGIRSMIKKLVDHNYVEKIELNRKLYFQLTSVGRKKVEEDYSVLRPKKRKQSLSNFLILLSDSADLYDPQFSKLKKRLLALKCTRVMRGVYLYGTVSFDDSLHSELIRYYSQSVIVVEIKQFFINEPFAKTQKTALFAIKNALPGVSKDITKLIDKVNANKRLINSVYDSFSSVFHMLELIMKEIDQNRVEDEIVRSQIVMQLSQWQTLSYTLFPTPFSK